MKSGKYYGYYVQAQRSDYAEEGGVALKTDSLFGYVSIAPVNILEASFGEDEDSIRIVFEKNDLADEYWVYYRLDTFAVFKPLRFKTSGKAYVIKKDELDDDAVLEYKLKATNDPDIESGEMLLLSMKAYSDKNPNVASLDRASSLGNQYPAYLKFPAPLNLRAVKGGNLNVGLSWKASSAVSLDGYQVWRKLSSQPSSAFEKIDQVVANSYTDTDYGRGVMFDYQVRAYSSSLQEKIKQLVGVDSGLVVSEFSNVDSGFVKLDEFKNFKVSGSGGTANSDSIFIEFEVVGQDPEYRLFYREKGVGSYQELTDSLTNVRTEGDLWKGVWPVADRKLYQVYATASSGHIKDNGLLDSVKSDTLVGYRTPAAPDSIEASKFDFADTIQVNWKNENEAFLYNVRKINLQTSNITYYSGLTFGAVTASYDLKSSDSINITFVDKDADSKSSYLYQVEAVCESGKTGYSEPLNSQDSLRATGNVRLREVEDVEASKGEEYLYIEVFWDEVPFADSYEVYRLSLESNSDRSAFGNYLHVGTVDSLSFQDVPPDKKEYYYRVLPIKWYDGQKKKTVVSKASFTNVAKGWLALYPPVMLSASKDLQDTIEVVWSPVDQVNEYNIYKIEVELYGTTDPKLLATVADTVYRDVIDQENAGRGYYYFVEGETSSGRKTAMSDTSEVGAAKVYPVKYHSMVLLSGENKVRISWVIAENTDSVRITFLSPSNQIIDSVLSWRESFWETTLEEGEIGTMEIVSQGSYNMSDPVKDTILSPLQAAELLSISRGKEDTIQLRVSIDREPRVITIYRCDGYEEGLDPKIL